MCIIDCGVIPWYRTTLKSIYICMIGISLIHILQFLYHMYVVSGEVTLCVLTMEKNKCESWNHFGVVFKLEGSESSYCKCLACHESKVKSHCMISIIQNGIIWYYMMLYNALFAQWDYTKQ